MMSELTSVQVCKFGGASVKDAASVRNLFEICQTLEPPLVIVVSAMGKMTNAFEKLVQHYFKGERNELDQQFAFIENYHIEIVEELFGKDQVPQMVLDCINQFKARLAQAPSLYFDFEYDQIVSFGELLSTHIVSGYLNFRGLDNCWLDVRKVLKTDDLYRDANVDWGLTTQLMQEAFSFSSSGIYLTQGFLGGTLANISTTLGREGSDYTAAIVAYALNARQVSIWKDVPGVLNADPRYSPDAVKLDALSYLEALELAFFGAKVIHPKTLKPLQNKQIPLFVKSFLDASLPGTSIRQMPQNGQTSVPVFILKTNQLFMTLSPRDFSFIMEESLSEIFGFFSRHRIRINLMQTSALNFSVCVDFREGIHELMTPLKDRFSIRYNTHIELLTIRHYTSQSIDSQTRGREIINSQISRRTARFVMRQAGWKPDKSTEEEG